MYLIHVDFDNGKLLFILKQYVINISNIKKMVETIGEFEYLYQVYMNIIKKMQRIVKSAIGILKIFSLFLPTIYHK